MLDLLQIVIIVVVLIVGGLAAYLRKYRRPSHPSSSVLLSYYSEYQAITPVAKRRLSDGSGHLVMMSIKHSVSIDIIYLSFTTQMRLLAIPTETGVQINPSIGKSLMEPVVLEGDFPNYFNLYSNNKQGFLARYVLDPKAMAFVVDFCNKHSWELINNELIFVSTVGISEEEIVRFIQEIRPAVEVPGQKVDAQVREEYKHQFFKVLACPICGANVLNQGDVYPCPNGHGKLLTGRELSEISRDKLNINSNENDEARVLGCPNCKNQMVQVNFGGIVIDSCINCPYRWLDTGELE
jgi:uncharacterized protein YbaR (Trm112 family)